jgi:hypothetical protein
MGDQSRSYVMKKKTIVVSALTLLLGLAGASALAAGNLLKFDGWIGMDPVAGIANGAPVLNVVRGVNPGGRAWVIRRLKVEVKDDGQISAKGEGLLLGGGDGIGTRGAVENVAATLFCGAVATAVAHSSGPAALDANGDFEIRGVLDRTPPNPCVSPVLLIRNFANGQPGAWFAAGILKD